MRTRATVLLNFAFPLLALLPFYGQSAGTGALAGVILDPSGAVVANARVLATNVSTGERHSTVSGSEGLYRIPMLVPGSYELTVEKSGFKIGIRHALSVVVTEVTRVDLQLQIGAREEDVGVTEFGEQLQTETTALGRGTTSNSVSHLPLAARNYIQIIALSPGVEADVSNASQLGRGGNSGLAGNGNAHAHGALALDNNFQMDGIQINDLWSGSSGNIPIPNPDTIQEFKVQTGLYDASYGRNGGANVDLVTKEGSNTFHGNIFEFYRDTALNANDYFSNQAGQPKAPLHQNQFGGTLGGPIRKKKLLVFGSYQRTNQVNGLDTVVGSGCSTTALLPPLTNNRSPEAIGALFAGQRGLVQNALGGVGPAVVADGSNINRVALTLLQMKNPDGSFYIPNPEVLDKARPVASQGLSVFHTPCTFTEDQFMTNGDYLQSEKSRISVRYFYSHDDQTVTFPTANFFNSNGLPGSPQQQPQRYHVASISHSSILPSSLVNLLKVGYVRTTNSQMQKNPFTFSDIGVNAPAMFSDLPSIYIQGCCWMGGGSEQTTGQNRYTLADSLSWERDKHSLQFGGGYTPEELDVDNFRDNGVVQYSTWPDFLLGLSGNENGTDVFSNILSSFKFLGSGDRSFTAKDGFTYIHDTYKIVPRLTFNLGLRYEHLGSLADGRGRNANFDPTRANHDPPAGGTLEGYVVPSNFRATVPPGVTILNNSSGIAGLGQDTWGPRFGFAWQMFPKLQRIVLRSGYGIYYTRATAQQIFQLVTGPPFGFLSVCTGTCNAVATAEDPFSAQPNPAPSSFPMFRPYSPTTANTITEVAQNYRPPISQQYSLGLQSELARNIVVEASYVGSRGTHLIRTRGLNQAGLATPVNPVNGVNTTTIANISQRLPYPGFTTGAAGVSQIESEGASWYNGLETSLTKRLSHGSELLASYTWSKLLSTNGGNPDVYAQGNLAASGDQLSDKLRYGPAYYSRNHRLEVSYVLDLPAPRNRGALIGYAAAGWTVAGVTTIQTGNPVTFVGTNPNNYAGITGDRVQLAGTCSNSHLVNPGPTQSKLDDYFNSNCISPRWPVIGSDGIATGFGNSGTGLVTGPGQHNFDIMISKAMPRREGVNLVIRAEFFNAFNTPQFANPGTSFGSASFGVISALSTNPRIIQLAVKFSF